MVEDSRPFTTFNFRVELTQEGSNNLICNAAFSECDGLEMTMTPKTIREGGNNNMPIHLIGPVSYGQLTLKRGMTDTLDLWNWFENVLKKGQWGQRASGTIVILSSDSTTEQARFELHGCMPVKLKAPALNAKEGLLAIEEMQIAYEMMSIKQPGA
jgi:phage tail-like protein